MKIRSLHLHPLDIGASCLSIAIGVLALIDSIRYSIGTPVAMGPGFFPFVLSMLMILSGLGIILVEGRRGEEREAVRIAVRPVLAIMAGILAFALLIERAGLAPAVMASAFISTLAEPAPRFGRALILAVLLAVATIVVFKVALGLQVNVVNWR